MRRQAAPGLRPDRVISDQTVGQGHVHHHLSHQLRHSLCLLLHPLDHIAGGLHIHHAHKPDAHDEPDCDDDCQHPSGVRTDDIEADQQPETQADRVVPERSGGEAKLLPALADQHAEKRDTGTQKGACYQTPKQTANRFHLVLPCRHPQRAMRCRWVPANTLCPP